MYAHVFDQVNIPWSLHLNQHKKVTTKSKYVIFFSMLFYIFRHGLIPVTIFCLHPYFLLLRVFKCRHIFAVYYRWDFSGWQYKAGKRVLVLIYTCRWLTTLISGCIFLFMNIAVLNMISPNCLIFLLYSIVLCTIYCTIFGVFS